METKNNFWTPAYTLSLNIGSTAGMDDIGGRLDKHCRWSDTDVCVYSFMHTSVDPTFVDAQPCPSW